MRTQEQEEAAPDPLPEWDRAAEQELAAIEAAYFAKRSNSHLDQDADPSSANNRPKCRRLPDWGSQSRRLDNNFSGSGSVDAISSPKNRLWNLAPHPPPVNLTLRYPALTYRGRIVYSRTTLEVEQATMKLLNKIKAMEKNSEPVSLGFDIEWRPVFRRGETQRKAAVMQICMDFAHCYVLHIIHSGIPPVLKSLLEDTSSVKVGVCIANDAVKIWQDYNVNVEPLVDLSGFANLKLGGAPRKWGLASLTEMLTCKQLEKPNKIRMGNWETNFLSKAQLQYAATDAFASLYLYQVLKSFADPNLETENMDKNQ